MCPFVVTGNASSSWDSSWGCAQSFSLVAVSERQINSLDIWLLTIHVTGSKNVFDKVFYIFKNKNKICQIWNTLQMELKVSPLKCIPLWLLSKFTWMRSACTQFAILSKHILFLNTFKGKVYMKWDFLPWTDALFSFFTADKTNSTRAGQFLDELFYCLLHCNITSASHFLCYIKEITLSVTIVLNLNKEYLSDDLLCSFLK